MLIFDSVKLLVLRCEQQIRIVQISYICILTVSQFTRSRELKQLYRDVPLLCRTVVLCFFRQNLQEVFLSRTSFLNNFASCRPVETPVKVVYFEFYKISQNYFLQNTGKRLYLSLQSSCSRKYLWTVAFRKKTLQMVVFEIKHVNHKGRTNFTMANRFCKFIWSLFFRIWNKYGNILAAEFDVNRGSSV